MPSLFPRRVATATGLTFATAAVGMVLAAPAALAADALPAVSMPASVAAGTAFTVSGAECIQYGKDVHGVTTVYVVSDVPGVEDAVEVAEDGSWSVSLTFPAGTPAGPHEVETVCDTYWDVTPYPFTTIDVTTAGTPSSAPVTSGPSTPNGTGLATTGGEVGAVLGVAANTPGTESVTTSKTTGATSAPGQKVVKIIGGFQPFEVVTLVMHSTPTTIGTFTADANGVVTAEFTLPAGTPAGTHTLVFDGTVTHFEETLTVTASGTTAAASGDLAYTGASVTVPLVLGGALVLAGGGALLASRRRTTGASQA
jgi:LPXTG-motif cell wall-anchored protein